MSICHIWVFHCVPAILALIHIHLSCTFLHYLFAFLPCSFIALKSFICKVTLWLLYLKPKLDCATPQCKSSYLISDTSKINWELFKKACKILLNLVLSFFLVMCLSILLQQYCTYITIYRTLSQSNVILLMMPLCIESCFSNLHYLRCFTSPGILLWWHLSLC